MGSAQESLVAAVGAIGSDLDLPAVLARIVQTSASLVGARYGALGVLRADGRVGDRLIEFVTEGLTDEQEAAIGHRPRGEGILGLLIDDPRPLRLADLSAHPRSAGFPPGHPPMHSFLGVPIRVRGTVFGNLYLTDKEQGLFTAEDEDIVTALADAAGVAVDNAWAHEESLDRERWLRAIVTTRTEVLSGAAPAEAARLIARTAQETAGASAVALAIRSRDGGWRVEAVAPDEVDADALLGAAVTDADALAAMLGDGPTLAVPADASGETWGLLALRFADGHGPARRTGELVTSYAGAAAVAVELAARRADAEQLALMGDRDRIARDLHDVVIQRLFASGMALQSTERLITDETAAARVRGVVDDLDDTIAQIRSAIYALQTQTRPQEGAGIRARLLALADRSAGALGITPSMRFDGAVDALVGSTLADHLVAVTSEALSNIARHASAARASVSLEVTPSSATLVVEDDGVGVPPGGRRSGLVNLAHRAAVLGGTLDVGPATPTGTRLVWSVPLSV
ncbi:MAG: GAF domain-containing protein [Nocardioides sp.]